MEDLEWLQSHMREQISSWTTSEQSETVLNFPRRGFANVARKGRNTLNLVYQAAEVIRNIEDRAKELQARTQDLTEEAIEKLQLAETQIEDLESRQLAVEACINKAQDHLQLATEALKKERARAIAAEKQVAQLEMRARTAEARAKECEDVLARVEEAIRTEILQPRSRAAAA
jgi:chromosome segregation ATPase